MNRHEFQDLCNDYRLIKDVYSLSRATWYIDHAVAVDLHKENDVGRLVIEHTLQVLGEYLKNTADSPHVSDAVEKRLLESAPKYLKEIITSLRNSVSHAHSLARRILIQQEERLQFFEEIQNDLKKIATDVSTIILDLKFQICKDFIEMLKCVESQEDYERICDEVGSFWCREISHATYEPKEWKKNNELIKDIENSLRGYSQDVYENVSELVNRKTEQTKRNMRDKQKIEISEEDRTDKIRLHAKTIPRSALPLTVDLIYNCTVSSKKIKQIDRLTNRINEREHEAELEYIFRELAKLLETEKEIKSFWKGVQQRKVLSETKLKILQEIDSDKFSLDDVLVLIEKLNVGGKAGKNLRASLVNGNVKEVIQGLKKIDDPYRIFVENVAKANFFLCDKYKKALKGFFKKSVPVKENIVDSFIKNTMKKIEVYLLQRWEVLGQVFTKITSLNHSVHWIAAEMLMLDITEIISSTTQSFDGTGFLDGYSSILVRKNLRNYLAHGDPLIDILEYSPRVSKFCHKSTIKPRENSLSNMEDFLFGEHVFTTMKELSEHFERGLSIVNNQYELFQAIQEKNFAKVTRCLKEGADVMGVSLNGETVLRYCAASNNTDLLKLFLKEEAMISESLYHVAIELNTQEILKFTNDYRHLHLDSRKALLRTALMNGRIEMVQSLLKTGVEMNAALNEEGNTALHFVAKTGNQELVKILLKNGADVNLASTWRETALHKACESGHLLTAIELLNGGADVQAVSYIWLPQVVTTTLCSYCFKEEQIQIADRLRIQARRYF